MNTLKLVGIALFTAAVTAVSVVWYVDYKINRVTEAIMAPVYETTEKVNDTIEDIETAGDTVADTVESGIDQAKSDITYEIDTARDFATKVGDWLDL